MTDSQNYINIDGIMRVEMREKNCCGLMALTFIVAVSSCFFFRLITIYKLHYKCAGSESDFDEVELYGNMYVEFECSIKIDKNRCACDEGSKFLFY